MTTHPWLDRTLAILGTILVLAPITFMLFTAIPGSIMRGRFVMDFLIPAEVGPAVIIGAALLLFASLRMHSRRAWMVTSIAVALVAVIGAMTYASMSGLANGEIEAVGWPLWIVSGGIGVYDLAVLAMGIGGILLIRDSFAKSEPGEASTNAPPLTPTPTA